MFSINDKECFRVADGDLSFYVGGFTMLFFCFFGVVAFCFLALSLLYAG
jgi:hypothetical protein